MKALGKALPENIGKIDTNKYNSYTEKSRQKKEAEEALAAVKRIEQKKIKEGYVYMHRDKVSKLVSPYKVAENIENGWAL